MLMFNIALDNQDAFHSFIVFALVKGVILGPIVHEVPMDLLVCAFCYTFTIFGTLTATAMLSNPDYFFIDSVTWLLTSLLLCILISYVFLPHYITICVDLTLGLAIFCGYVLVDTWKMVWEFEEDGKTCSPTIHALGLYLDFLNIFIRILEIFSKRDKDDKKKK